MVGNQSTPGLNRDLSSNFGGLRTTTYVKFTEDVMCMKKHILLKKCLQMN